MAETTNNFTGGKMNKDIDDRLLGENVYRNAINLQISKSENSDVGSLQTVLGNEKIIDFNALTGSTDLDCIGYFVDTANNRVFLFLTNYTDTSLNGQYLPTADNYIYVYDSSQNTYAKLVEGAFLNFSKNSPIIGVNLLEDLLFWTDNRNQPRKINVVRAFNSSTYYTIEEQISVAKLSPLYAIDLYAESTEAPGSFETTMYDVTSEKLPDGEDNPYYDPLYVGDPAFLEDKFVKFSYRWKFDDNEYSIIAPFTQTAYIPKQDGYFLYEENPTPGLEAIIDDETAAYRSTIISFMYNKVNNIILKIKLPCDAVDLTNLFKIVSIDILYKDAGGLAVEVVDTIPVSDIIDNSVGDVYSYNYQSKKPFKVLPERDLLRVYDKTPVKALGQEIISNRVVYSNYQDKQSYPKYLNYNVGFKNKSEFSLLENRTSIIEYPNHTLKQNRNYQVGVILGDKFGRQSGVILSNAATSSDSSFGASTLYVPYKSLSGTTNAWPGYALNILFNNPIDGTGIESWPGIYNGDQTSVDYNPLGWYSYKIVVKQTEQDYYNVYLPGLMASYPTTPLKELDKTSHTVLIGDNINKVPRDLNDISSSQEQYRSSVRLYSRVNNVTSNWLNQQYNPGNTFSFVNTISTIYSLFSLTEIPADSATEGYEQFYQSSSNPLIARLSTVDRLGITFQEGTGPSPYTGEKTINLAVCETEAFESRLDIYWETSTTGIIEELNLAIAEESGAVAYLKDWSFSLNEGAALGTPVAVDFYFADATDTIVDVDIAFINLEVRDGANNLVTSKFALVPSLVTPGLFSIETSDYFYYGFNSAILDSFTFKFTVISGTPSTSTEFVRTGALVNLPPSITNYSGGDFVYSGLPIPGPSTIANFDGVNGSNPLGGNSTADLAWAIVFQGYEPYPGAGIFEVPPTPFYTIGASSGILTRGSTVSFPEHWRITIRLTDAGGLFVEITFDIFYNN